MSNTIRRPRTRPRVASVNFRSLWWAMRMQAVVQIRFPRPLWRETVSAYEQVLSESPTTRLARAHRVLYHNEARRYYP